MSDTSDKDKPEIETYTFNQLIEKTASERQERLQNGVKDGNYRVYFQKSNLTIQIEYNGTQWYEIDLERCNSSDDLLDWIFHIHGKNWGHLLYTILLVLDDACEDVHGEDANSLYQPGKTVDW
ncbi:MULTISPECIES: hypothetical protein [Cyanophyceae]|uniref:hypothetical protein n=1 Tax=Cyanophyceae TaxID=3028117 RepID=UPI001681C5BA|nr:hypothetical protein [Trichocoleus sp. FACHB-40]MBD2003247.1 hypothetical protein [Trichocoleus sp. FACHB-40]